MDGRLEARCKEALASLAFGPDYRFVVSIAG
jgi:hypothetical protein